MTTSVYIGTSLDGFIAKKDGGIEWLTQFASEEAFASYEEFTSNVDAIVIGRGTFEKVLSFPSWPYDKKVFVLSSSIKHVPDPLRDKVTIVSMAPAELVTHLSREGFSSIYVDGGKVIQGFLNADLIDRLIVSQAPVILGDGVPLFGVLYTELQFTHLRTMVQSNGLVRSYYERKRK
jgi:dihydrofolate reductase